MPGFTFWTMLEGYTHIGTMQDNGIVPELSRPFYHAKSDAILTRVTPRVKGCCKIIIHPRDQHPASPECRNSHKHHALLKNQEVKK